MIVIIIIFVKPEREIMDEYFENFTPDKIGEPEKAPQYFEEILISKVSALLNSPDHEETPDEFITTKALPIDLTGLDEKGRAALRARIYRIVERSSWIQEDMELAGELSLRTKIKGNRLLLWFSSSHYGTGEENQE
jgi:hypothetical protein